VATAKNSAWAGIVSFDFLLDVCFYSFELNAITCKFVDSLFPMLCCFHQQQSSMQNSSVVCGGASTVERNARVQKCRCLRSGCITGAPTGCLYNLKQAAHIRLFFPNDRRIWQFFSKRSCIAEVTILSCGQFRAREQAIGLTDSVGHLPTKCEPFLASQTHFLA